MKYISTKEAAVKWNITPARVHFLIQNGRIPGAKLVGNSWLIPEEAQKPLDGRKKHDTNQFFWPMPIYSTPWGKEDSLSKDERRLFEGQRLVMECRYEEAEPILLEFLGKEANFYLRIGALYHLVLCAILTSDHEGFRKYVNAMNYIQSQDFPYKKDCEGIFLDSQGLVVGRHVFLGSTVFDPEYTYCPQAQSYLSILAIFHDITTQFARKNKPQPLGYELMGTRFEQDGFDLTAMSLYLYIAAIYKEMGDNHALASYLKKALNAAQKTGLMLPAAMHYHYMKDEMEQVLQTMDQGFADALRLDAQKMKKNYINYVIRKGKKKDLFSSFTQEEFILLRYARLDTPIKDIAAEMGVSYRTVGRKYKDLCKKAGVKRREDLMEHFVENYLYV